MTCACMCHELGTPCKPPCCYACRWCGERIRVADVVSHCPVCPAKEARSLELGVEARTGRKAKAAKPRQAEMFAGQVEA